MIDLAEHIAETLDIGPGTRVFEVDCGDGALLVPFHLNRYLVGGIDPAPEAIELARASMPDGVFQVGAAADLDPGVPWDVVIWRASAGAADDRLRGLVARMFAKATHAIALLDVADSRRQWMLHALAEVGATAIQFEDAAPAGGAAPPAFHVFARV